jgi:hypothetical protein
VGRNFRWSNKSKLLCAELVIEFAFPASLQNSWLNSGISRFWFLTYYGGNANMLNKKDVFNFAKTLARNFILPAILKSLVFAILGGVIFFIAGLLVYNFSIGLLILGTHIVLRLIVAILILAVYTALGALIGLLFGATSAISNQLPSAEQGVHQMLNPVMGSIIEKVSEKTPIGRFGVPIEQFNHIVDGKIADLIKVPEQRSGLFSVINFVARIVMQKVLTITRTVLVVNFVQDLQANGETQVTVQAIEKFTRGKLMRLVTNYVRMKLYTVRKIAWAASGILVFIAILSVAFNIIGN